VRARLASSGAVVSSTASQRTFRPGEEVLLAIRSEKIEVGPDGGENVVGATVKSHVYVGSAHEYILGTAEGDIRASAPDELPGGEVQLYLPPEAIVVLPVEEGPAAEGEEATATAA
jgi:ABC-type Fe3+/spermidine/putrescine transport system ATPase subunit